MSAKRWLTVALLCLGGTRALTSQPAPLGPEFQINTYTTDRQGAAAVDIGPDGTFVVAWRTRGLMPPYPSDIRLRRFAADGTPLGDDFQANSLETYDRQASVAVASTGEFIVAWASYYSVGGTDPSDTVAARRFTADGTPLGPEFQVNSFTTGYQDSPRVAFTPAGEFIVVWSSDQTAAGDLDFAIVGRRFAADGTPFGDDFQINTYTTSFQYDPSVGVAGDGEFIVVWSSLGSSGGDDSNASVHARRFAADGTPLDDDFQVNSYTTSRQFQADVAVLPGGDFVVTWTSYGSAGDDPDKNIQARLFTSDGVPLGDDFQVNTYTFSEQLSPAIAAATPAAFAVTWSSRGSAGSDSDEFSVQARAFTDAGAPIGDDFQVNTQTTDNQFADSVAVAPNGDLVAVWTSDNSMADPDLGVLGQRFVSPLLVFADGFETGDTSAWSSTVP